MGIMLSLKEVVNGQHFWHIISSFVLLLLLLLLELMDKLLLVHPRSKS